MIDPGWLSSLGPDDLNAVVGGLLGWAGARANRVVDDALDDRLAQLFRTRPAVAEILDRVSDEDGADPEVEADLHAAVSDALTRDPELAREVAALLRTPAIQQTNHTYGGTSFGVVNGPVHIAAPLDPR
jgi:hypothetical protein